MRKYWLLGIVPFVLWSCGGTTDPKKVDETPTRGDIRISVDDSYKLLIDAELDVFMNHYKYAHITPQYKPERDVITDFINDSVRTIVTSDTLTQNQLDYLKSKQVIARRTLIAIDAVAFIINRQNPDSLMTFPNLRKIFKGEITQWSQMYKDTKLGKVSVVFDNMKSSNARSCKSRFKIDSFPERVYAVQDNQQVIDYVSKNPGALGVISVNWISDKQDSTSRRFLNNVRVVALSSEFDDNGVEYMLPYQAYIAEQSYPFTRRVYMYCRESFSGLGRGFTNYVAGEQGQRIVMASGLMPAQVPLRLVQVSNNMEHLTR